jgi:uncharacterized protein YjbJ (UPF0337 family)
MTPSRQPKEGRSNYMGSSKSERIKGGIHETKGEIKEKAGEAIGNPDLRDRGTAEKVAGKVQRKVGEIKKVFGQ